MVAITEQFSMKVQVGEKEDNQRHCKMGIAFKILVKCKENSSDTIRFIVSRVQHVKGCKNYVWLNYTNKIVWAISQRKENLYKSKDKCKTM